MKIEAANKHNIFNKKTIIIVLVLLCLVVLSLFVYQSYASWKVTTSHNIINGQVAEFGKEFAYTGTAQEYTVPKTGYYEVELWGAGRASLTSQGGYTKGTIYLEKDEKLYFYVGGMASKETTGGWNGGRPATFSGYTAGVSGYGATDVRLVPASTTDATIWYDSVSLRSRIMVAAGGGGISQGGSAFTSGSYGGGLIGTNGLSQSTTNITYGGRAVQTAGGSAGLIASGYGWSGTTSGGFGYGGLGTTTYGGGGGGGYYGGGGAGIYPSNYGNGGGGSSYISGYAGVNSVQETGGSAAQPLHTNDTIHYSQKRFINGYMQSGVNTGAGKAKITYLTKEPERINTKLNNVRYIKSCGKGNSVNVQVYWVELQAVKNGINVAKGKTVTNTNAYNPSHGPYTLITDGIIEIGGSTSYVGANTSDYACITVDLGQVYDSLDEIVLWLWWNDNRIFYQNTLSVGSVNTSGTTSLATILHTYTGTNGYVEKSDGRRYNVWNNDVIE